MKAFQETTIWNCEYEVPNHTYFLSDSRDKMYGYVNVRTGEVHAVKNPSYFHTRGRKFKEVANIWGFGVDETPKPSRGQEYRVTGSGKNIYTVTDENGSWSCTCPAAKWQKGDCKHIKNLQIQNT